MIFHIDKDKSEQQGALVVQPSQPISAEALRKFGPPFDKARLESGYISIPSVHAIAALKQMTAMGQISFQGKVLAADFFGKVNLKYIVEPESSQAIHVTGHLCWGDNDIDIRQCDFVGQGNPHWFIRGNALKLITSEVSWKDLKRVYDKEPWILEGKKKDQFLEDEHVHIVMKGVLTPQPNEVIPVLILKDRAGACADLWIDYGNGRRVMFNDPRSQGSISRNPEIEKSWEKDLLETDYINKIVSTSHYYCPVDKVAKSLLFLLEVGWQIIDWKGNRVLRHEDITLHVDRSGKDYVVKGKVCYETFEVDVSDVVGAFNRRDRFVQIGSGTVGLLPDASEHMGLQSLAEEGEVVSDGIKVRQGRLGSLMDIIETSNNLQAGASIKELFEQLKDFSGLKRASVGSGFQGTLRPYQQEGVDWLSFLWEYGFHGLLADDMGLGKTVQVLALLSRLPSDKPHLIVAPTSLLFNWKKEIEKFLPGTVPYLHHGLSRSKDKQVLSSQAIILTSYATLRLDLPLLSDIAFQTVILDEAQVIKNPDTQVSLAVCKLQSKLRLSITGTPVENSLQELWSHFRFLMPDLLGSETDFAADIQAASADGRYLQRIKKRIRPFLLRRKKEDVAKDLPERIDQVVWVEMSPEQRQAYDAFLAGVRGGVLKKVELDGMGKHRIEILEAILRLRQICCHPLLVGEPCSSAKLDALMEDIETAIAEGRKVLVYSQFTSMLKLIGKSVQERSWAYSYLDGQTQDREKVVSSFQNDPSIPLFLISLKAGGVGLNLTAADYVFLVDPWWNDAVEEQAINRAHRIGRKDTVFAKRYVTVDSIEEKMMKLKAAKSKLVDDIFDEEALSATLTLDDLRALLV